jgi:hypothetical protein
MGIADCYLAVPEDLPAVRPKGDLVGGKSAQQPRRGASAGRKGVQKGFAEMSHLVIKNGLRPGSL